jgi:hypothetical protein
MALYNSQYKNSQGKIVPLTKGRIHIQSEAAEVFYKDIQMKSINSIPKKYQNGLSSLAGTNFYGHKLYI